MKKIIFIIMFCKLMSLNFLQAHEVNQVSIVESDGVEFGPLVDDATAVSDDTTQVAEDEGSEIDNLDESEALIISQIEKNESPDISNSKESQKTCEESKSVRKDTIQVAGVSDDALSSIEIENTLEGRRRRLEDQTMRTLSRQLELSRIESELLLSKKMENALKNDLVKEIE